MTMKRLVWLLCLLSFSLVGMAQRQFYYDDTQTLQEDGYVYQCDVKYCLVYLYNKENKLTYVEQVYKDTGKSIPMFQYFDDVVDDDWTEQKCDSIIKAAFSEEQKRRVRSDSFGVNMYIDSDSGKVVEVCFSLSSYGIFATIPVSVYRKIELDLKKYIWFTPVENGRRLNYIYRGWSRELN